MMVIAEVETDYAIVALPMMEQEQMASNIEVKGIGLS